jgi:glycosyltransferase involved in cell wall biosynthesis
VLHPKNYYLKELKIIVALPIRVLIVVENLPVPFDRRVWMEATTLQQAGYHVSVISPKSKGFEKDYEIIDGIHIYRHPLPTEVSSVTGYFWEYLWAVTWEFRLARRVWQEQGFDIVHICNPPDLLFLVAGWFKLFQGTKVIFDQHDLNPELYRAKYGRRDIFYHGLLCAEFLTFATADVVISTNESYRSTALTRGRKKNEQVFVVRSGPDLSRFPPLPPNPTYCRGRKYLVGYLGVMGEQEGIDYLLKAVRYSVLEKGRQDVHFMLIGSGPVLEQLKALAKELGIAEFVEFTGRVPDQELRERLSSCDVCVNPDRKNLLNDLSTMNKVLEYMALGKPIVQFNLLEGRRSAEGASLYAISNDEIDFAEKVLWLLDSPQYREQMGAEGQRRMKEMLEWRHQAPRLLEAYAKALNHKAPELLVADYAEKISTIV